ncbi:MAG: hypothetical protein ACPG40_09570, partial [Alphaproteobacteria bacterium]
KATLEMHQSRASFMPSPTLKTVSSGRLVFQLLIALFFTMLTPGVALTQSASFAFGQGGFAHPENEQDGVFNECLGAIDGDGTSSCGGITQRYGGYGQTYLEQHTEVKSGYGYPQNGSLASAAASYDRYGFGTSAANCTLSRNNGMTNCASGAYGSANGASAKLSLSSTR